MTHGENHAKETVLLEVESLDVALSNGHATDPETHGKALLLLLRMVKPIFNARLVTEEECADKMEKCPGAVMKPNFINWPGAAAVLGSVGMICTLVWGIIG